MLKEFKAFVMRGNLLEIATAFILGLAFAAVVTSFVDDVVMQIIAAIVGKPSFNDLTLGLGDATVYYGAFLTALVNFLLIAFVMFMIVRTVTKLQRPAGAEEITLRECPQCLTLIPTAARRCSACTADVGTVA